MGPLAETRGSEMGGALVSFSEMVRFLSQNDLETIVVNTNSMRRGVVRALREGIYFLFQIASSKVVFINVSQNGTRYLGPFLFILTRLLFGKKFVFRPFGGWLASEYRSYNFFQKAIFEKTLLRSDMIYLQTKNLVEFFEPLCTGEVNWLPTTRIPDYLVQRDRNYDGRFVYVGRIVESKGIDLILQYIDCELLNTERFTLFGPICEKKYEFMYDRDFYGGELKPEEVRAILMNYDVLVLPTWYEGEGYPGIIVEAYSVGLPVVASRWKDIPEIIEEGKTGFLVEPKSFNSLCNAIGKFNSANYQTMSQYVTSYFNEMLSSERILTKVIRDLDRISQ